jgi:hypothetical protein
VQADRGEPAAAPLRGGEREPGHGAGRSAHQQQVGAGDPSLAQRARVDQQRARPDGEQGGVVAELARERRERLVRQHRVAAGGHVGEGDIGNRLQRPARRRDRLGPVARKKGDPPHGRTSCLAPRGRSQ